MKVVIEERGNRLRELGASFGIRGADAMTPALLRQAITTAYHEQRASEEREAMRQRHIARFGKRVGAA